MPGTDVAAKSCDAWRYNRRAILHVFAVVGGGRREKMDNLPRNQMARKTGLLITVGIVTVLVLAGCNAILDGVVP